MTAEFTSALLEWYRRSAREMPWRDHPDPYAVWVSEIMLQQTRVETVRPYFLRWVEHFPTIQDLAAADLHDVLNLWEGLGYYSRARNMHKAAQVVMEQFDGKLPDSVVELKKLPGIGPYTAGAIASIAFGLNEPVLDGNVRRVLSRLFLVQEPADAPSGERLLWRLAAEHLPPGEAGDYNQGLMELGATLCSPKKPACAICPIQPWCLAAAQEVQETLPVLKPKVKPPHYIVTAAVISQEQYVLIAQRPEDGLLGGMWEFPGGKIEPGEDLTTCLQREIREELGAEIQVGARIGVFRHAYTHFKVTLHAFACRLASNNLHKLGVADWKWVEVEDLSNFPMGKIDRQISNVLLQNKKSAMMESG